jgi:hypothetical protein
LYFGFSISFSCQADNYKIPAQQQAVNVVSNFMRNLIIYLFFLFTLSSFKQTGMDLMDAYTVTYGNTRLFEQFEKFYSSHGLPSKLTVGKTDYEIKNKEDITKAIKTAKPNAVVALKYPGVEMWYADGDLIPFTVDIRKVSDQIKYGQLASFDKNFTVEQFKKLFPKSASKPVDGQMSFFRMVTQETGDNLTHFIVERGSKDDKSVRMPVEFTFQNGKLIFICFFNIG